jgi:hypothetical protein
LVVQGVGNDPGSTITAKSGESTRWVDAESYRVLDTPNTGTYLAGLRIFQVLTSIIPVDPMLGRDSLGIEAA